MCPMWSWSLGGTDVKPSGIAVYRPALMGLQGLPVLALGQVNCRALSSSEGQFPPGEGLMAHHCAHGAPTEAQGL